MPTTTPDIIEELRDVDLSTLIYKITGQFYTFAVASARIFGTNGAPVKTMPSDGIINVEDVEEEVTRFYENGYPVEQMEDDKPFYQLMPHRIDNGFF